MTSGVKNRTRQAIIDAAIDLLAGNPACSLGDIAAAAQVGRTTLHRYFGERADLLSAVAAEGGERLGRAAILADLDRGSGAEALLRLCREYFDLGSLLSLMFSDQGGECWESQDEHSLIGVIERGHADGSIDPALPSDWVLALLWSQLYAAWEYRAQRQDASRHHVLDLLTRTLSNALRPPQG
ncbi:TetR/AcrR family transcriptional regulator [Actinoplanes sp. TRM 88003]|uniref:TetR/AcrR family transcriptional regulator n=1 Tax=Paractinoplanes aksuensis TaxID=2939490 RepID=A0ABT1DRZ1_9ACTN|nr:TetR/AcrR family transcriptional regulator [Actinoplanes aksuensis]MCO8273593.1 TetR/AcrR family transcriptional regulator [Actinoplanes aksuensis]